MHLFHFGCLSLTMSHSVLKAHGVSLQGNPILLLCHLYCPLRLFIAGKRVECACCPLSVGICPFLCTSVSLLMTVLWQLWCLCPVPAGCVEVPCSSCGFGRSSCGWEPRRLMRTEQLQFISIAPSNQSIMTTTHAPQGDAAGFSVKSHLNKSLFSWLINTGHGFHNTATGETQKYMAKSCTPVLYIYSMTEGLEAYI